MATTKGRPNGTKPKSTVPNVPGLYDRIRDILESARAGVARTVNTTQVMANWLVGREIVEEELRGKRRADYGQQLVAQLSKKLAAAYGTGWSGQNLFYMKQFYQSYPRLPPEGGIFHAPRGQSTIASSLSPQPRIGYAVRSQSVCTMESYQLYLQVVENLPQKPPGPAQMELL